MHSIDTMKVYSITSLTCLGDSDPMNFFSNQSSMNIDFYHTMACYLVLGGSNAKLSQTTDSNWIMPDLARNVDSASPLVTEYVRESLAQCNDESLAANSGDFEGTSLRKATYSFGDLCSRYCNFHLLCHYYCRVGAANHLACHKTVEFIDVVLGGGWEGESISRLFIYIEGVLHPISSAGRALAGWRDSTVDVYQPVYCFMQSHNKVQIENLIIKLFQCSVQELHPRGKLWPLAKCMFATLLRYLPQLRTEYPSHSVLSVLAEKATKCDITMSDLLK